MRRLGVVDDHAFDGHASAGYHPERPERLTAARAGVAACAAPVKALASGDATFEALARVHEPAYLERLASLAGRVAQLDADTYVSPGSWAAATRAAGAACALVDALLDDRVDAGLALVRPPGHHARPDRAMGFCLLNNVAVAAAHALDRGCERVAIVDWDVHHGNGTQEVFYRDPRVLYVSLHQWPFYPGTGTVDERGEGAGEGFTVNVPLGSGAGPLAYRAAFDGIVAPVVREHAPDLVLVSAGYDAHVDDPLGRMRLDAEAYARMTASLIEAGDASAKGRLGLVLEGGYDLRAVESSVKASLDAAAGLSCTATGPARVDPRHLDDVERARRGAARHWHV